MPDIYSEVLSTIITTQDVETLRAEVQVLRSVQYQTDEKKKEKMLNESVRASVLQILQETQKKSGQDWEKFLSGLEGELTKLRVVELTLVFEPTQKMLQNMQTWIKKNVGESVILQIKQESNILGGAIIVFGGKYRDYSLKKKIHDTLPEMMKQLI